jgi:3-carboxy-cis,cis-muconate cycloisomerase
MQSNIDRLRAELPREAADEWFDPALAEQAAATTLAQVKTLQTQLDSRNPTAR